MNCRKSVFRASNIALLYLLVCSAAFCMRDITAPFIGYVRASDGNIHTLYGLPDNFLLDSRTLGHFDAASFSDEAGLLATDTKIELVDKHFNVLGEYNSSDPAALLNVDGPAASAIAWLPASRSLLHWDGSKFSAQTVTNLDAGLEVTSVRAKDQRTTELLLRDAQGAVLVAVISNTTGELLSLTPLPGASAPAFWFGKYLLFENESGLVAVEPNNIMRPLAPPAGDLAFQHVASNWLLVQSRKLNRLWALNITSGAIHVSEMPVLARAAEEAQ